jgi:hypothetical protein
MQKPPPDDFRVFVIAGAAEVLTLRILLRQAMPMLKRP